MATIDEEIQIYNHTQRKVTTTFAVHGLVLNVAQASGNAQVLLANPSGNQTIASGNLTLTTGVFTGNGSGLNALNASNLGSGTVPLARLAGITNAEIAVGAGIVYTKLNLSASIVNADIAAGAAIVDTKLATISTPGKVANAATTGTSADTNNTLALRDASGGFAVDYLTITGTPVNPTDAVTIAFLQAFQNGLDPKASVRAATTAALPANTRSGNVLTASANGVLPAQDGVTLVVGNRLLVWNEGGGASSVNNGIYTVTSVGSAGTPWVLTRATDFDSDLKVTDGSYFFVGEGTLYGNTQFVLITNDTIVLNTTALQFTQYSGPGAVTAGNGLTQVGNVINISTDSSLTAAADQLSVATGGILNVHIGAAAAIAWTKIDKTGSSLADLTTRSASDLSSGTLADARLSTNIPLKNAAANAYTGAQQLASTTAGGAPTSYLGLAANNSLYFDATSGPVIVSPTNITFLIDSDANSTGSTFTIKTNVANTTGGTTLLTVDENGLLTATSLAGAGGGITGINGSNISTGTVADARLSANVPLKNAANVFTGQNDFQGKTVLGDGNQDVVEIDGLVVEADTRNRLVTYNGDGTVNVITVRDGATAVSVTTYAYNGDGTVNTKTTVAGGKTATETFVYTSGEITSVTKSVV